jgi:hypothetical protein
MLYALTFVCIYKQENDILHISLYTTSERECELRVYRNNIVGNTILLSIVSTGVFGRGFYSCIVWVVAATVLIRAISRPQSLHPLDTDRLYSFL